MEEKIKLYSKNAIAFATFLGGPVAAGILIRRNSLNLGREKEGLIALIVGIISTTALIFLIPDSLIEIASSASITGIYTGIIFLIVEKIHGKILKKHKEEKNEFYSNWKAAGIGFICMAVILGTALAIDHFTAEDWDVETYNSEISRFENNDLEAMKLFDMLDSASKDEIAYFIEQTGIPKWKENIEIIDKISGIENISAKYQKQNQLLLEYCKLRIEAYELISKAILNETSEYDEEIIKRHTRIDEIIDKL